MQNYKQEGNMITLTAAPYDVDSGEGVVIGSLFGVAANPALTGDECVIQVVGVFEFPKVVGEIITTGLPIAYDTAVRAATITLTGHTPIGVAIKDAASGDLTCEVRLHGAWGS